MRTGECTLHPHAILMRAAPAPQRRTSVPGRPLSSEPHVPMRLRRCHMPYQTVLVCLRCPTSRARDIHCI